MIDGDYEWEVWVKGQLLGRASSNGRLKLINDAVKQGRITNPTVNEIEYKLVKKETV